MKKSEKRTINEEDTNNLKGRERIDQMWAIGSVWEWKEERTQITIDNHESVVTGVA